MDNKTKDRIIITALLAAFSFAGAGVIKMHKAFEKRDASFEAERQEAKITAEFLASRGSDYGYGSVYIVKHRATGKRFVVTSKGGITYLDQQEPE